MMNKLSLWFLIVACCSQLLTAEENFTHEFCLAGRFDLGLRQQGFESKPGENYPMRWCVTYEGGTERLQFSSAGHINADAEDEFSVRYLSGDTMQIMDGQNQPVVAFIGAIIGAEASAHRRIDPHWLRLELEQHPEYIVSAAKNVFKVRYPGGGYPVRVDTVNDKVTQLVTYADFPLRGKAEVAWQWDWSTNPKSPSLTLTLEGSPLFKAESSRRQLSDEQAKAFWATSDNADVRQIPGKAWPSRVNMTIETLSPGVYMVNGVRTGFHHLVVATKEGLVVVDAPAGWIEIQQIPPADLVPGLGVSGLSELFVDFLQRQFPDDPISAVLLTHIHDDHAGGARAFAAAGADIYAPAAEVSYLDKAFNQSVMPMDRQGKSRQIQVKSLSNKSFFGEGHQRLEIKVLTGNPHSKHAIAAWLPQDNLLYVSDIKMPHSQETVSDSAQKARYCWFANWAEQNLPKDYSVMDSHSHRRITSNVVAAFAEANQCSG